MSTTPIKKWRVVRAEFKDKDYPDEPTLKTRLMFGAYCGKSIEGHSDEAFDTLSQQATELNKAKRLPTTRRQVREIYRQLFGSEEVEQSCMDLIMRKSKSTPPR